MVVAGTRDKAGVGKVSWLRINVGKEGSRVPGKTTTGLANKDEGPMSIRFTSAAFKYGVQRGG